MTELVTNFMEQNPSWEAKRSSASKYILHILWTPKIYYYTYKRMPPVPILSHVYPVHASPSHFFRTHFNFIHPSTLKSSNWSLSLKPPHQNHVCPAHLIILYFITQITFGEQYKSLSSSLCHFLHSPVTSSLLGRIILLNALFSNTLSFFSSLNVSNQESHPHKQHAKLRFCAYIFG